MDDIDYHIVQELLKNARTSFLTIAKQLGISPETVRKRYQRMKKEGTIERASIQTDLSKIGYQGKIFMMITNAVGHSKSETVEALSKTRNAVVVVEIIGEFDVLAIVMVDDFNNINNIVNGIKRIPSVGQLDFSYVYDTAYPTVKGTNESLLNSCKKRGHH
ncbi:MAG: Lrp/AsnC family transcriptional regulator [Candidatus Bathyarchaeia archaeon]